MEEKKTGGAAFPVPLNSGETYKAATHGPADGMTLRDYFAAQVLPSIHADYCKSADLVGYDENWKTGVAMDAYALADAMLKERSK